VAPFSSVEVKTADSNRWIWPVLLIIRVYFAPKSPWWLVRRNRLEEAKAALGRLTTPHGDESIDIDEAISLMMFTIEHERELEASTTYLA
jgi:SP family general alpha glucoside:H+ symporter-like MFS transporter